MSNKILFINFTISHLFKNDDFPVGGAAVQTSNWIKGFQKNGYKVGVLGYRNDLTEVFQSRNIQFVDTYLPEKGIKVLRNIYYRFPSIFFAIKKFNPDLIYMDVPGWNTFFYAIVARILQKKFILRISNNNIVSENYKNEVGLLKYCLLTIGFRLSYMILCQNMAQLNILKHKYLNSRLLLVYNPFEIRENSDINISRKYIAWVGIFQRQKNLNLLYTIAKKCPDTRFKIAGKSYDSMDIDTREAITKLYTLENVEFAGYIKNDEVHGFLKNAFCLLNTSLYEGFPNTFLEALSVGTPILTLYNVDPDDIIKKNNLGIVCENESQIVPAVTHIQNLNYSDFYTRSKKYLLKNHNPKDVVRVLLTELSIF